MSKPVRINGKIIPESKRGRKVKLYEMMSSVEIDERMKKAFLGVKDKRSPEQLEEDLKKIRAKEEPVSQEIRQQKLDESNKNLHKKTRAERNLPL